MLTRAKTQQTGLTANAIGQRNLTEADYQFIIGRRYNRTRKRQGERGPQKSGKNYHPKTAETLAAEYGRSYLEAVRCDLRGQKSFQRAVALPKTECLLRGFRGLFLEMFQSFLDKYADSFRTRLNPVIKAEIFDFFKEILIDRKQYLRLFSRHGS